MINPKGASERRRIVSTQIKLRSRFERGFQRQVSRSINRIANKAIKLVQSTGSVDLSVIGAEHHNDLSKLFKAHYARVGEVFGRNLLQSVSAGTKDVDGIFDMLLAEWVESMGASRVTFVSEHTRKQIQDAVAGGISDGLGTRAIGRLIREKVTGIMSVRRGDVIARTETHAASNGANIQAARSLGIRDLKKEWLSAEDGRVRADHARVDGVTIPNEELFSVGSAQLMQPGDPTGPPEQIINCRCTVAFITPDA